MVITVNLGTKQTSCSNDDLSCIASFSDSVFSSENRVVASTSQDCYRN